jgi:hypothetical protein
MLPESEKRWPDLEEAYLEKRRRVESVLERISREQKPHLLAFAEITDQAAHNIRDKLFPDYRVHSLPGLYVKPDFHLAILYDKKAGFVDEDFLAVSNIPNTSRPMAILGFYFSGHRIRFFTCHWTARFSDKSDKWRELTAHALNMSAYDFLHPNESLSEERHVVILGDLNEEPFGKDLENWLYTSRDRGRSKDREHYTDAAVKRVRLYNCSWRLLGERFPHPYPDEGREATGSYYWRDEKTWHTFDQVIVTGSLLTTGPPHV